MIAKRMGSIEEKAKRRKRLKLRSKIAKDLVTNPRYKKRVVTTKKGKIDLANLSHAQLIKLIEET